MKSALRIHLGHHFYGAGNLGDDFMLAGFLTAVHAIAPNTKLTCSVPFALAPLQRRFPAIEWLPYEEATRAQAIANADVWLGLGGSPFQSALSRWFIDHLIGEAGFCVRGRKPMYFLGVGVQTASELDLPEVRRICARAAGIWTRDSASAERIAALPERPSTLVAGADLAHVFFRQTPPPPAAKGRITLVANFDFGSWPGQVAALRAIENGKPTEQIWLAQERRELPGAERSLYAALPPAAKTRWRLILPDEPEATLSEVLARWPSGERLVTSRYHAALAGAWAGSRVIVIATNEKLRAAARETGATVLSAEADELSFTHALETTDAARHPTLQADRAVAAVEAFLRSAVAHLP